MTHANNDELVEIALKIAAKDAEACELRQRASLPAMDRRVRQMLEKEACSLDDDICQLCTDMRNAVLEAHKIEVPAQPGERIVPLVSPPEWRPMEFGSE